MNRQTLDIRSIGFSLGLATLAGCAGLGAGPLSSLREAPPDYRIYDTAAGEFIDMDELAVRVAGSDVVLFGEVHDDVAAHRAQVRLLSRLSARRSWSVLGLEMFERDVQPVIDAYVDGRIERNAFLADARPWPNFETDYEPLLEEARRQDWRILATNTPQSIASAIARDGLDALRTLDLDTRRFAAIAIECPRDEYWDRFVEAIHEGAETDPTAHAADTSMLERTFEAQCVRDETMAETIATNLFRGRVFHVNGAFHSDFRLGIVPRLLRRLPTAEVTVVSALPVEDLDVPPLDDNRDRADFVVFTSASTD